MILSKPKEDYISIDEEWIQYNSYSPLFKRKVHIVELNFENPTTEILDYVLNKFKWTNRFIIKNNIRFYNSYFRNTRKKYYVENVIDKNLISFFRKNNKILFNFTSLENDKLRELLETYLLEDLLKNVEVIKINKEILYQYERTLENWSGNAIIMDM